METHEPRFLIVTESMYIPSSVKWPGSGKYKFLIVGIDAATGDTRIEPTTSLKAAEVVPAVDCILERFSRENYFGDSFNQLFR